MPKELLKDLNNEQKQIFANQYEFLALSEKLQKMIDIAARQDSAIKKYKEKHPNDQNLKDLKVYQKVRNNINKINKIINPKEKANNTSRFSNEIKTHTINENDIGYIQDKIGFHKIINISDNISYSLHFYSPPNHNTKYF